MKIKSNLTNIVVLLLLALLCAWHANAANLYVSPGGSIQSAVDAATDGDTICLLGGSYGEDVSVVGKRLTFQRQSGQLVSLTGSLTVYGVTNSVISGITFNGAKLVVNSCSNVFVTACTSVVVNASSSANINFSKCNITSVDSTNSALNISRSKVTDYLVCDNKGITNLAVNILQSSLNVVRVYGGQCRILYSLLAKSECYNCDSVIVGNYYSNSSYGYVTYGSIFLADGKADVRNNEITLPAGGYVGVAFNNPGYLGAYNSGIVIQNSEVLIVNNYLHDFTGVVYVYSGGWSDWYWPPIRCGVVILANNSGKLITIKGNVFWNIPTAVYGQRDGIIYSYNNWGNCFISAADGGVISTNNNQVSSPTQNIVNAGPPEPFFNDRDGSRNDIGLLGGSAYDPDGKTTDKPISFLLQANQQTVIKGNPVDFKISGGGIVVGK